MSIDLTTYLGPYVLCKTHKVEEVRKKRACSNTACSKYESEVWDKSTQFCPSCGSGILEREYTVTVANVNRNEVQCDLLREALVVPAGDEMWQMMKDQDFHIWISNYGNIAPRRFSNNPREGSHFSPITPEIMVSESDAFYARFEKEIQILRQEYGEENVSLGWGMVHYVH